MVRAAVLSLLTLLVACAPAAAPSSRPAPSPAASFQNEAEAVGYFRVRYPLGTPRQAILAELAGRSLATDGRDPRVLVLSVPAQSGETRLVPAAGGGVMRVAAQTELNVRFHFDPADRLVGIDSYQSMVP